MSTIGILAARILADAQGIKSGLGLTRNELKLTRDAFLASRSDAEKLNAALAVLESAKSKGAFQSEEEYARAVAHVRQEFEAATPAQQAMARAARDAKAAFEAGRSPVVKYREEMALLVKAHKSGLISEGELIARKKQLAQTLPEVIAKTKAQKEAQDAANKAATESKRIAEGLRSSTQVHRDRMGELTAALRGGHITQQQFVKGSREASAEWWSQVPIVGGLGSKIAGLGPAGIAASAGIAVATAALSAAVAAAAFFANAVRQQFAAFEELATKAGKVGVSTSQMWALSRGADRGRVSTDALSNAMVELQKRLVETKPTTEASRQTLEDMKRAAPVEQLLRTMDALRQIQNPTDRAAATMKAFGDQGKELLPILRMNSDEYARWKSNLESDIKNPIDAAAIQAGNDAMRELRLQFERVAAIAAAKLAPVVQVVAERLREWLDNKETMDWITQAMSLFGDAVGLVGGYVVYLKDQFSAVVTSVLLADAAAAKFLEHAYRARAAWNRLTGDAAEAAQMDALAEAQKASADATMSEISRRNQEYAASGGALAGVAWASHFRREVQNKNKSSTPTGDAAPMQSTAQAEQLATDIEQLTARLREQTATFGLSSEQVEIWKLQQQGASAAALAEVRALQQQSAALERQEELRQNVGTLTARLREQIATFGMSSDQIEIWKLRQQGAGETQLALVQGLTAQRAALDEHKRAMDEGKQLADQYASPQEKLAKRMQDLARLYRVGAIDLKTYQRAQEAELATARDAARQKQAMAMGPNTAIRKGSAEDAAETAQRARDALAARDATQAEREVARSVASATGGPVGPAPAMGRTATPEPTRVSVETDRKTEQFQRLTVSYLSQLVRLAGGTSTPDTVVEMM